MKEDLKNRTNKFLENNMTSYGLKLRTKLILFITFCLAILIANYWLDYVPDEKQEFTSDIAVITENYIGVGKNDGIGGYDFSIPVQDGTLIYKNGKRVLFDKLNVGDIIHVEYFGSIAESAPGKLQGEVKSITVLEQ